MIVFRKALAQSVLVVTLSVPCLMRAERVPFVGCPSDGQLGPLGAPTGKAPDVALSAGAAAQLAWYKAKNSPGVLGPRGWNCFGTYGSSGATLYVAPDALNGREILSGRWKGLGGPAIEISSMNGGTSGRFEVAHRVFRYFPQHAVFAQRVRAEGMADAAAFQTGPFPHDTVRHVGPDVVEFMTPAGETGQGTESMLRPSALPIEGMVRVSFRPGDDPYDVSLAVRLTVAQQGLAREIVKAMVVFSGRQDLRSR